MSTRRQKGVAFAIFLICATNSHCTLGKTRNELTPISLFDFLCIKMISDDNLLTQLASGASIKLTDKMKLPQCFLKREGERDTMMCPLKVTVLLSSVVLYTETIV